MPVSPLSKPDPIREEFVKRVRENFPEEEAVRILEAFEFAEEKHRGVYRKSGEPFITHPISVSLILMDFRMDPDTIIAGLLHDILEDTETTPEEIKNRFGEDVLFLVEAVTKIQRIPIRGLDKDRIGKVYYQKAETYRKMILAFAHDFRVLIIKLADRLHNMQTLESLDPRKREQIARETLEIYAPLAHRLGMWRIKWELEDLSFKYLEPEKYAELARKIREKRRDREKFLSLVEKELSMELRKRNIDARIISRPKHIYSVYQKMVRKNKKFEELYDLYGIRIITKSSEDVYRALGVVHSVYTPVPGRFKDYVAYPKPNFYQSLHTTVIGPDNRFIEIQIRSEIMHEIAEFGIAAHWRYKEQKELGNNAYPGWLHNLINTSKSIDDPRTYYQFLKDELREEDIFVFTPRKDVIILKKHSTPVDFAYAVHTELGHRTRAAKVNGKLVPLDYELKNGDVVEILTGTTPSPSKDWLRFVKTSSARQKIKAYFRKIERAHKLSRGKEEFMKLVRKVLNADIDYQEVAKSIYQDLRLGSETNLYIQLVEGRINQKALRKTILQKFAGEEIKIGESIYKALIEELKVEDSDKVTSRLIRSFNMFAEEELYLALQQKRISRKKLTGKIKKFTGVQKRLPGKGKKALVEVNGIKGLEVRFARCCIQLPGDEIVGIVTTSHVVTIHRKDCPNVLHYRGNSSRILPAYWLEDSHFSRKVKVRVVAEDMTGLDKFILNTGKEKPSLFGMYRVSPILKGIYGGKFIVDLTLNVSSRGELEEILGHIRSIKGVVKTRPISGVD